MSDQPLISRPPAGALAQAAQTAAQLGKASKAANTRRAYDGDWRAFRAWCTQHQLDPLPAAPATIGLYIAALGSGAGARAPSTIERALAGIAHQHRMKGLAFDRRHPAIADVLAGLKRTRRRPVQQKAALMPDILRRLLEPCRDNLPGYRDRALLLLQFNGALRRSELVGVDREHLKESNAGFLLTIPWAKGDQEGQGTVIGIPRASHADLCPVQAVKEWLHYADIDGGPVFRRINRWGTVELDRLSDRAVALIVKARAHAAGLSRAEDCHTLRSFVARRLRHDGVREGRTGARDAAPCAPQEGGDHAPL